MSAVYDMTWEDDMNATFTVDPFGVAVWRDVEIALVAEISFVGGFSKAGSCFIWSD